MTLVTSSARCSHGNVDSETFASGRCDSVITSFSGHAFLSPHPLHFINRQLAFADQNSVQLTAPLRQRNSYLGSGLTDAFRREISHVLLF